MFVGRPRFSGFVNSRVRVFIMIKLNGMWSFWAKPKPRKRRRKPKTTNHEGQQRSRASAEKETKGLPPIFTEATDQNASTGRQLLIPFTAGGQYAG